MRLCHFFLLREGFLKIGHPSLSYAVDDIDGGESKVVSDLNESLGSRHFPTL